MAFDTFIAQKEPDTLSVPGSSGQASKKPAFLKKTGFRPD
jgi:hypothetical protein